MIVGTYIAEKKPKGFRTLTVSSSVVDLADASGGIPKGATRAVVSVSVDAIRWEDDAGTPTNLLGIYGAVNGLIELPSLESIVGFRAIRVTTDATLSINYYGF